MKQALSTLLAAAALAALVAAAASAASTGSAAPAAAAKAQESSHYGKLRDRCVGTRLEKRNIKNRRGRVIGHTELWYSPIKGGQNCVMTYNRKGSPWTRARIWRVKNQPSDAAQASGDQGFYEFYAGGSYVNRADGHCVVWGGSVGDFFWYSRPEGVHCD